MSHFKITIVGAGAIGGLFAGWLGSLPVGRVSLPAGRVSLSVVARGHTLVALRSHGLRLEQGGEQRQVA
ncbi:MAG: hypothetical protein RI959_405, partial [Pseudomonadota bacterium]